MVSSLSSILFVLNCQQTNAGHNIVQGAMLSRKVVSSFLNTRSVIDRKEDSESGLPHALYQYSGAFGVLSRPSPAHAFSRSGAALTFSRPGTASAYNSPSPAPTFSRPSTASAYSRPTTAPASSVSRGSLANLKKSVSVSKLSKDVQDGLRHVNVLGQIKQRREAARMKYQQILLSRTSTGASVSSAASTSSNDSCASTLTYGSVSPRRRKPRLLRQVSEIDEREDMFLLEAETYSLSAIPKKTTNTCVSPTPLDISQHTIDISLSSKKKKPHIKKYAEEYNMVVSAVSKLFIKHRRKGSDGGSGPLDQSSPPVMIRFGTLKKIQIIDVGVGTDVFVELRPGMMTYYNKISAEEEGMDVKSVPLKKGMCVCRPTKKLKKAPFPGWDKLFEVSVKGKPTQFLMCELESDRGDWIKAFEVAMRGACNDSEDNDMEGRQDDTNQRKLFDGEADMAGNSVDILLYLHVRGLVQAADSRDEYIRSISILIGKTIFVPVQWLRDYFDDSPSFYNGQEDTPEEWDILEEELLSVNGHIARGGIESIIGSIKRHILDLDRCSSSSDSSAKATIKESQAIFFARDILLSCNRMKCEENSFYCASTMLGNDKLVFLSSTLEEIEPIKVSLRRLHNDRQHRDERSFGDIGRDVHDAFFVPIEETAGVPIEGTAGDSSLSPGTVEVVVRAPIIYRVCSNDLLQTEAWALVRCTYVQKIVLGPQELKRINQFVQFDIVQY